MKNKGGNTGLQHSPPLYPAAFTENLFIDSNTDLASPSLQGQQSLVDLHVDGITAYLSTFA